MLASYGPARLTSSLGAVGILGLSFLAYALATAHSLYAAAQLVSFALAFALGLFGRDRRWWGAFYLALLANLALSVGFYLWDGERYFGIWGNPNFFGVALALGLAGALTSRLWILAAPLAAGLAFTQSRGAIAAGGVALLVSLWRWSRFWAMLAMLAAALVIATHSAERSGAVFARLGVWQGTLEHLVWWGHGWGSFYDQFQTWPVHIGTTGQLVAHPYSDILDVLFSFGLASALLWAFIAGCLEGPGPKLVVATFFLCGLTFYPASIFPCGQLFFLELGKLYRSANA